MQLTMIRHLLFAFVDAPRPVWELFSELEREDKILLLLFCD